MKKSLVILLVALVALVLLASCKNSPDTTKKGYTGKEYTIGQAGPGGGIVFYDVDADNDSGNKDGLKSDDCGWRYLEAASKNAAGNGSTVTFVFGYYRTDDGNAVIGTAPEPNNGEKIGKGEENTATILEKLGKGGCKDKEDGTGTGRDFSAASIINSINENLTDGFGRMTDWFLPSKEEAVAMFKASETITSLDLGDSFYWTSTEASSNTTTTAVAVNKADGAQNKAKSTDCSVRPVRRF